MDPMVFHSVSNPLSLVAVWRFFNEFQYMEYHVRFASVVTLVIMSADNFFIIRQFDIVEVIIHTFPDPS